MQSRGAESSMPQSVRAFVAILVILVVTATPSAQTETGAFRGRVVDSSDGVLPGVSISAAAPDGRTLATTVTDGAGEYAFPSLPMGPTDLTFELQGFDTTSIRVVVAATSDPQAIVQ